MGEPRSADRQVADAARRLASEFETARVRLNKIAAVACRPTAWPRTVAALRRGVFPSFEHARTPFGSQHLTVVDVGTARGQFALFALWRFPQAQVLCFEPLPEAAAVATELLPSDRAQLHGVALSASAGTSVFHVSARDDSSSLLPIGANQVAAFPGTSEARQAVVPVETLSRYLSPAAIRRPCLLKLDVQGGELAVLQGAGAGLDLVDEVLVETSFVELYEGQGLATDVISLLAGHGFDLVAIENLARARDGSALQADFLFRRSGRLPHAAVNGHATSTEQLLPTS